MRDDAMHLKAAEALRERCPANGTLWKHVKSGHEYLVMGGCVRESDLTPCVLYARVEDCVRAGWPSGEFSMFVSKPGDAWCRPLAEFLDGRFVPLA